MYEKETFEIVKMNSKLKQVFTIIPLFGILIFVLLYIVATLYYPGGSQTDMHSIDFNWINNYWCNLLSENSMNGQPNPALPIAVTATIVLCLSLAIFWYNFPKRVGFEKFARLAIQFSVAISMLLGILVFTGLQDSLITAAILIGTIPLMGTFIALFKLKWRGLFWFGIFNIVLIVVNNILYFGLDIKFYLPIVQKITFLLFLLWISLIDISLNKWELKRQAVEACSKSE